MLVLLAHAAATLYLVGLIWVVQGVHYPLFARVGPEQAQAYAREHVVRITRVVGVPMLVELATGLWLALRPPPGLPRELLWTGLLLLALIWGSTALLQVPEHRRLEQGPDLAAVRRLVRGNWLRTLLWTVRGALVLLLLARLLRR
ncbi:hypothetical protein FGE12_04000 [Aggregicoccus sp. 17bor-14]|nr:hypothetical protein [Aggregicoccus sp. 17bor-14]